MKNKFISQPTKKSIKEIKYELTDFTKQNAEKAVIIKYYLHLSVQPFLDYQNNNVLNNIVLSILISCLQLQIRLKNKLLLTHLLNLHLIWQLTLIHVHFLRETFAVILPVASCGI